MTAEGDERVALPETELPETELPETELPETELPETELAETVLAETATGDVTRLLRAWSHGDREALERLMPLVMTELRRRARGYLRRERAGHTLQPTALVNEVYLRLVDQRAVTWQDRAHFFAASARLMRQILVDHARALQAEKRGGQVQKVQLDEARDVAEELDLVALDDALAALAHLDERQAKVVELRFFAGLRTEEVAEVLGVGVATVGRDWRNARAWLLRELGR